MTINELYNQIKEAMDNGCGNLEVYAQEFGKHRKLLPIDVVNIVSEWSSGTKKEYAEIIYEPDYSEEDIRRFNDIQVQSYRNERQLIFDAWRKESKESAEMIKDMLNLMKYKMKPCNTERCQSEFDNIHHKAESYLEHIDDDTNFEVIVPVPKE